MATKKLGSAKATDTLLLTSANLASEVTGVLPVANGGNGTGSFTDGQILIGNTSGNTLTKTTLTAGTNIAVTNGGGTISVALATAPTITGGTHTALTSLGIRSTAAAFDLLLASAEAITANRTLTLNVGDANRTLTLSGNPTLSGITTTGAGTIATGGFTLTVPATGTAALRDVANTFTQAQTLSLGTGTSLTVSSVTESTSATTGSVISEGGITSKKTVYMSGGCIVESKSSAGLLIGTGGSATAGSTIASSGGTSGNYNGMFFNSNASGSGDTGSQYNTAQPTWRMALGGGAAEWNGADSFAISRVAAGGTVTSPTIVLKISSGGNVTVGHSGTALGKLESRATSGAQIVAAYDASNTLGVTVNSSGVATITGSGSSKGVVLTDGIVAGTGTARAKVGGTIRSDVTAVGNVGVGEDTLNTYTIPASTLAVNGESLWIRKVFSFAANANIKQVKIKYGATTIYASGAVAQNGGSVVIDIAITRTGAATQIVGIMMQASTASLLPLPTPYSTTAETLSGTVVLLSTGEATADNDIVERTSVIEFIEN